MLRLQEIAFGRGGKTLLNNASVTIHPGWKAGIIGNNGCGKSTLFALITGQVHQDSGDLQLPVSWKIGVVEQEVAELHRTALQYVMDGDQKLQQLNAELLVAEQTDNGNAIAHLHHELSLIDGYNAKNRAEKLLAGLGFSNDKLALLVAEFSGGWRVRLNLARALFCPSDLLLLDEPTNHLDLDAIIWLQGWLQNYSGTVLTISHDRDFLDGVVDHIIHMQQQTLTLYTGNYSSYELQRAEQQRLIDLQCAKQQKEIAHLQSFINRFKAKASKAKQAQSRVKRLEKMEHLLPAYADSPFHFDFFEPETLPNPLLQLEEVAIGYGQTVIATKVNLFIVPGDTIALLGKNGAGKSTLLRALTGGKELLSGTITKAANCSIGYFAQHQLELLDVSSTPLQHIQRLSPRVDEQTIRNFLGSFGFQGEMATAVIARFSGGEKSRLVLAILVWQKPNLLLLDEPTNHLDIAMRHALTLALQQFTGAIVLVSHDRHLIRNVCDSYLLLHDKQVTLFAGDMAEYEQLLTKERQQKQTVAENGETSTSGKKQSRQNAALQRQQLQPLRNQLKKVEQQLEKLLQQQQQCDQQLGSEEIYSESNKPKMLQLLQQKSEIDSAVAATEERWLELSEQLEQMSA